VLISTHRFFLDVISYHLGHLRSTTYIPLMIKIRLVVCLHVSMALSVIVGSFKERFITDKLIIIPMHPMVIISHKHICIFVGLNFILQV
jgi:hypothetical protein